MKHTEIKLFHFCNWIPKKHLMISLFLPPPLPLLPLLPSSLIQLKNRIRLLEADLEAAEDKNDDYSSYVELSWGHMIWSTFTSHLWAHYISLIDQSFVEINHLSCCCATTVQCPRVLHMQDVVATRHSHTSLPYYYYKLVVSRYSPPNPSTRALSTAFLIAISLFECSLVPRPEREVERTWFPLFVHAHLY